MDLDTQSSKCDIAVSSSSRKTECTTNSSMGKPGIKRQISSSTRVFDGKHLLQSKSLISTPDLQVSIIDCNQALGKIVSHKWLLQEDKILFALIVKLERSEANFYAPFEGLS